MPLLKTARRARTARQQSQRRADSDPNHPLSGHRAGRPGSRARRIPDRPDHRAAEHRVRRTQAGIAHRVALAVVVLAAVVRVRRVALAVVRVRRVVPADVRRVTVVVLADRAAVGPVGKAVDGPAGRAGAVLAAAATATRVAAVRRVRGAVPQQRPLRAAPYGHAARLSLRRR
jgi:hypothetical protein